MHCRYKTTQFWLEFAQLIMATINVKWSKDLASTIKLMILQSTHITASQDMDKYSEITSHFGPHHLKQVYFGCLLIKVPLVGIYMGIKTFVQFPTRPIPICL